jgi:hypothetical protein
VQAGRQGRQIVPMARAGHGRRDDQVVTGVGAVEIPAGGVREELAIQATLQTSEQPLVIKTIRRLTETVKRRTRTGVLP